MEKLFIFAGNARSGKDTCADFLTKIYEAKGKKVVKLQFSHDIKEYAKIVAGWDGDDENKPREILNALGKEIRKNNPGMLIKRTKEDIGVYANYSDIIVVSDTRFPEEVEMAKSFKEKVIVKVERPNFDNGLTDANKKDATETSLSKIKDEDYDYIIINDSTLENLNSKVSKMIEEVEYER